MTTTPQPPILTVLEQSIEVGREQQAELRKIDAQRKAQERAEAAAKAAANGNGSTNGNGKGKGSGTDEPVNPEDLTYSGLLSHTLKAITEAKIDDEMAFKAELKSRFRCTDQQISRQLFELYTNRKVKPVAKASDGVNLATVDRLSYNQPGWTVQGDVQLVYGTYGTGKTTLVLAKAMALGAGKGFLDREEGAEPANSLIIATDSGAAALKQALHQLDIDPATHPLFSGPTQRVWIWAHAPEQGHRAWLCDIRGVIELERFIRHRSISYVAIDSAKSVASGAGWSYTDNDAVKSVLRYLREGVAAPTGACIEIISHDGTEKGSHSGAKAWAEDPSMVVALSTVMEDGRQIGVQAEFKKDRAALIDSRRTVRFCLDDGALAVLPGTEVVGNCSEAVMAILWDAHQKGIEMVSTAGLVDEAMRRFNKTAKTVKNTLGELVAQRPQRVVKVRRGFYALSPGETQRRGTPPSPSREDFRPDPSCGMAPAKVPAQSPGTSPGPSQSPAQSPGTFSGTSIEVSHRERSREDPPKKGKGGSPSSDQARNWRTPPRHTPPVPPTPFLPGDDDPAWGDPPAA